MDLLVYLAERQGQVISREELENNVWAGRVVSYDALTNSMVKLRKALNSSKENPVIKTVSKRGYSLVAEVTPIIAETTETPKAIEENPLQTSQSSSTLSDLPSDSLPEAKEHAEPERRQVTVVSCELLNAASLYDQMDPEDVHELLQHLQKSCTDVVKQYGGHIGYYTNGEMVIYYGYPEAHEGDAERAVRTALGLVESVHHLADKLPAFKKHLEVRMGVHTGLVVVGEMTEDDVHERMSVVGDTPSMSASLKQLAQPDTVVVSETTKRLVDKFFVFDKLEPNTDHSLLSRNIYCVQAMQYTPSRSETKLTETLTPLVGRETEIDLLLNRWEQSRDGESQVVMLCAEAGIGKSRILQGLQERLQDEPHERVLYFCSPYHTNSSLYPVIVHLQRTLKIQLNENANQSLDKLEAFINDLGLVVAETAPVFAELLSLPVQERYTGFNLQQVEVKRRTFECLVAMFSAMAQREPVLLILEDAH